MKIPKLFLSITFAAANLVAGFSQGVLLQAGDSYTRELNNFQFQFHIPPGAPYDPLTRILVGKQGFSGSFLLEAFEDNTTQAPAFSTNVTSLAAIPTDFHFGPAWQDFQGTVRVTMLSGSMELSLLLGTIVTPSTNVYSQTITVPEPSPVILTAGAALSLCFLRLQKRIGLCRKTA